MERKHDGLERERESAFSLETTSFSRVCSFNISLMMVDYSSDLHDLDTMGDELVIEGTTTPKGSSYILKDSLSDSDLLILMDIAKRNGGRKHRSASDIEMGRSPKASIGVESEIPSPSSFVDAMGALCSEIREMNVIQLHVKTTGDLKRCIAQQTSLEPNQQRLLFRGNEKEDREHLHMAGVKDNAKVLLIQEPARKRGSMKRLRALKCQVPVQPLLKSNQRLISLQKRWLI